MGRPKSRFSDEMFRRVDEVTIDLGKGANVFLESNFFESPFWMIEYSDGTGHSIDSRDAIALICAANGPNTQ